ncbi:hypothetical protein LCGC14_2718990 [marine sediment metagenome]|uniref:Uncharacterized protein n=1 Tax=marine sediment metagenome TaxID=412755 RepID=A0A0F8ZAP8_9ZZZZ
MAKTSAEHLEEIEASSPYKIHFDGEQQWKVLTRVENLLVKYCDTLREAIELVHALEHDAENPS